MVEVMHMFFVLKSNENSIKNIPKTLSQTTQNRFLSKPPSPRCSTENHQGKGLCLSAWTSRSHWDVSHGRWCLSGKLWDGEVMFFFKLRISWKLNLCLKVRPMASEFRPFHVVDGEKVEWPFQHFLSPGPYFESCGKSTRLGTSAFSICMVA